MAIHNLIHWTTLMQAVSTARLEVHRLRQMFDEVAEAARGNPEAAEQVYAEVGDTLTAMPERLRAIESSLDRASFVLIHDMESMLRAGLPISDLAMLDEAIKDPGKQASSRIRAGIVWAGGKVAAVLPAWHRLPEVVPPSASRALFGSAAPPFAFRVRARALLPGLGRPSMYLACGTCEAPRGT